MIPPGPRRPEAVQSFEYGADPYETAKALVWMMERYLNLSLGRAPATPRHTVADTLATIWIRTLYGDGA